MDTESSTKFIGSLTKFLQSLCNGYVEFDDGVELIGHIYLSVDAGKTGKTLNYFLNEKVCKNDNSVTFISNSFHAQAEKSKEKDGDNRKGDGEVSDSGDNVPRSTNAGTVPFRPQGSRSGSSPNQHKMGMPVGTKRPGSPLKGPPSQRRAPSPPSQRRFQSSGPRGAVGGSPVSKTVPSSPSSSSQDNAPSPSPARRSREVSQPTSNQSDNVGADNENDIPPNVLSINPTPEFASFLGSLTSDNQTSQDQHSPPDTKPDTDVTFIKEEYVSEPSSCAQAGSGGQHSGRSGEDSSSLYPVMLHQNPSVFPGSSGYSNYQGGASSTATSQQPAFPGSSQSDFSPVPGTSQDGADPSDGNASLLDTHHVLEQQGTVGASSSQRILVERMLPGKNALSHCKTRTRPVMRTGMFDGGMIFEDLSMSVNIGLGVRGGSDGNMLAGIPSEDISVVPAFNLPVQCPECSQVLSQARNLKRHYQVCHQATLFPCDMCDCSYNRFDNLQKHIKEKHWMQLACPVCKKICRSLPALEKHKAECATENLSSMQS